jgi:hypothetical protein
VVHPLHLLHLLYLLYLLPRYISNILCGWIGLLAAEEPNQLRCAGFVTTLSLMSDPSAPQGALHLGLPLTTHHLHPSSSKGTWMPFRCDTPTRIHSYPRPEQSPVSHIGPLHSFPNCIYNTRHLLQGLPYPLILSVSSLDKHALELACCQPGNKSTWQIQGLRTHGAAQHPPTLPLFQPQRQPKDSRIPILRRTRLAPILSVG